VNRRLRRFTILLAAIALAASQPAAANLAAAGSRLPVVLASASQAFDDACPTQPKRCIHRRFSAARSFSRP
jgi:hypothetical protein